MHQPAVPPSRRDQCATGRAGTGRGPGGSAEARALLGLQRAAGNRAVAGQLARTPLTVQRKLGFELEMLALVDNNGHPAPEKQPFGTYRNLTLDVDHSSTVETPAPGGQGTYDSIIELVTPAYPPENPTDAGQLLQDIDDARQFADQLHLDQRVPANTLPGITTNHRTDRYYVGNPDQAAQTTAASWQSTLGIRLSQIGALFDQLMTQPKFVTKHPSDLRHGDATQAGMTAARRGGQDITNDAGLRSYIQNKVAEHHIQAGAQQVVADLGGFLTLVLQYLHMGQRFEVSGTPKNIVNALSRTNMSEIFGQRLREPYYPVFDRGTREALMNMLTNPRYGVPGDESLFAGVHGSLTVQQFLDNVFFQLEDGVTNAFIGFQQRGLEEVNPATREEGPVLEVRNIAAALLVGGSDRFPPARWHDLANDFVVMVSQLNAPVAQAPVQQQAPDPESDQGGLASLLRARKGNLQHADTHVTPFPVDL
jgi:hypothetical protein